MDMAVKTKPWHRDDLARLPNDGNRYEVLGGRLLVTPQASYPHQLVAAEFTAAIRAYVDPLGVAHVVGPGAVPFGPNQLQPDVQVIPGPRQAGDWADLPAPSLVVEVLSRSTRHRDLGEKREAYLERAGVGVVWLADWRRREVRVCEGDAPIRIEREWLEWHAPGATAPLRIDVRALFTSALGTE